MPPIDGHQKLAGAVFSAIDEGSYATDQDVASAELSSAALESLSSQLEQARIIVKVWAEPLLSPRNYIDLDQNSISELSRLSATDIDGWIVQAKQLRQDINQTERKSQAIVQFAKDGRALREKLQDASAKVKLLDGEVVFNDSVVDTLRELQNVRTTTDATSAAIEHGQLVEASKSLKQSEVQASRIGSLVGTGLIGVIRERIEKIRSKVIDIVEETWSKLIVVDSSTHRLTIHTQVEG